MSSSRYPVFLHSLSRYASSPPLLIRRSYSSTISSTQDKLVEAAQRVVKVAMENNDGSIEANKRKREIEELQRALVAVEEGEEVSSSEPILWPSIPV